jgi:hypothetical protein
MVLKLEKVGLLQAVLATSYLVQAADGFYPVGKGNFMFSIKKDVA